MPRPGTPVIHPQMLDAIRPVAEAAMRGTCRLLRPSGPPLVMDEETLRLRPRPTELLWEGPCRYQPRSDTTNRTLQAGERPVTTTQNQLTIPWSAPEAHVDDEIEMCTSADPTVIWKRFRVVNVAFGEYQAERHLSVQDYETPRRV